MADTDESSKAATPKRLIIITPAERQSMLRNLYLALSRATEAEADFYAVTALTGDLPALFEGEEPPAVVASDLASQVQDLHADLVGYIRTVTEAKPLAQDASRGPAADPGPADNRPRCRGCQRLVDEEGHREGCRVGTGEIPADDAVSASPAVKDPSSRLRLELNEAIADRESLRVTVAQLREQIAADALERKRWLDADDAERVAAIKVLADVREAVRQYDEGMPGNQGFPGSTDTVDRVRAALGIAAPPGTDTDHATLKEIAEDATYASLHELLRALRIALGISQHEFARAIGVTTAEVEAFERYGTSPASWAGNFFVGPVGQLGWGDKLWQIARERVVDNIAPAERPSGQ